MKICFRTSAALLVLAGAFSGNRLAADDQIYLANGATTAGTVLSEDTKTGQINLELGNGIKVALPKSKVNVVKETADAKYYKDHAGAIKDDSASHDKITKYLSGKGFSELAKAHYQRIVELDPANKPAWSNLDYHETSGGWTTQERYQKSRGLMRDGKRWKTPQELALNKVLEDRKIASIVMKKTIEKHMREYDSEGRRGDDARAFFASLTDATALPILTNKILDKETSEADALMLLDVMFRLNAKSLTAAAVELSVEHRSQKVRTRCLEYVQDHPNENAVQQLLYYLKNKNPLEDRPETYNRVGNALELIGDSRCIPPLIDMLVTKHQRMQGNGANTSVGFNSAGGMGMTQGTPKAVETNSQNSGVLGALSSLSGENFGYNKEDWKDWYAHHFANTDLELRRDP